MSNITIDKEIFSFFDEFDKLFEEIDNNFDEYLGDYSQELYDKNKKIIKFIRVKLSSADYDLIPESSLQSIKNNIKEILVKFKDIVNVKKINIIDNDLMLNNEVYFDVILKETPYINSFDLEKSEQTNLIRDSINSIKNLTKSTISNVNKKKEKLIEDLKKFEIDIEDTNKKIENQKIELDKYYKEKKIEIDKNQTMFEERYRIFMSNVETEFAGIKKGFKDDFEVLIDDFDRLKNSSVNNSRKEIKLYIQEIEEYKHKAEKLLSIISNSGMASGYQKYANQERWRGVFWKIIAIFAFGFLAFVMFNWLSVANNLEIPTSTLVIKTLTTLSFLILGTYAAKEGSKYNKLERKYRRMELELASINLYLAEIDDEKRKELIHSFTKKYFGNVDTDLIDDDKQTGILDIVVAFLNRKSENNIKTEE